MKVYVMIEKHNINCLKQTVHSVLTNGVHKDDVIFLQQGDRKGFEYDPVFQIAKVVWKEPHDISMFQNDNPMKGSSFLLICEGVDMTCKTYEKVNEHLAVMTTDTNAVKHSWMGEKCIATLACDFKYVLESPILMGTSKDEDSTEAFNDISILHTGVNMHAYPHAVDVVLFNTFALVSYTETQNTKKTEMY